MANPTSRDGGEFGELAYYAGVTNYKKVYSMLVCRLVCRLVLTVHSTIVYRQGRWCTDRQTLTRRYPTR